MSKNNKSYQPGSSSFIESRKSNSSNYHQSGKKLKKSSLLRESIPKLMQEMEEVLHEQPSER